MSGILVAAAGGSKAGVAGRMTKVSLPAAAMLVWLCGCSRTDEVAAAGLEGVWSLESMIVVAADGQANRFPVRASLYIFTDRHYSMTLRVGNDTNPPFAEPWDPTDAEKIQSFDMLGVNTGWYEADGPVLTLHPVVARDDVMGGTELIEYQVNADTLRLAIVGLQNGDGVVNEFYGGGGSTLLRLLRVR